MFGEIKINEKSVKLKASLLSQLIYKQTFGKDMLVDVIALDEYRKENAESEGKFKSNTMAMEYSYMAKNITYQIMWAFAKTADENITSFENWIDEIEDIDYSNAEKVCGNLLDAMTKIDRKNE